MIFCLTNHSLSQIRDAETNRADQIWALFNPIRALPPTLLGTDGNDGSGPPSTTGNEVIYSPTSFEVWRGRKVVGGLDEVGVSDDVYVTGNPGFVLNQCSERPLAYNLNGTLNTDSPVTLSISTECHANTFGVRQVISVWNWNANQWVSYFEACHTGTSPVAFPNDSTLTINLTEQIADFVETQTGNVRVRVGWGRNGLLFLYPWKISLDDVYWTTTEN